MDLLGFGKNVMKEYACAIKSTNHSILNHFTAIYNRIDHGLFYPGISKISFSLRNLFLKHFIEIFIGPF
jgi:hypothetical protein